MGLKEKLLIGYLRTKLNLLSILSKKKAAAAAFKLFTTPQIRVQKELPPIFTAAREIDLDFLNYNIKGYGWNETAQKKLLILHGFESTSVNFAQYVTVIKDKGFAVYAFDAPAHGRSSGETVNAMVYRDFIKKLNEKFGPFRFFICHSFGGLALSLALEEIPHDENFRVVFIAPATETTTAVDQLFRLFKLKPAMRKAFENYISEIGGHGSEWFSVNRAAKNIHAKLLWVHDREDDMTPLSDVKPVMNKNFPNFEFYITEGLGHRRIYRDKVVVEKITDFITA